MSTTRTRHDVVPCCPSPTDGPALSRDRSAVDGLRGDYVAAVVRALTQRGVLTCPPQHTGSAGHLTTSVVIDCTALRVATWESRELRRGPRASLGGALQPDRAGPVAITWDEHTGWSAGMRHVSTGWSFRYLSPNPYPAPVLVADFVTRLALGTPATARTRRHRHLTLGRLRLGQAVPARATACRPAAAPQTGEPPPRRRKVSPPPARVPPLVSDEELARWEADGGRVPQPD